MVRWITPFVKQCFVTSGVAISMAQFGLVFGITAILIPQLQSQKPVMLIDESTESWIAAIPGFALLFGNFTIPTIMGKYGRKVANIISVLPVIVGWLLITSASNTYFILAARFLQGISMGMSTSLGPILIGEYTSPKYRGAFLSSLCLVMAMATLTVHSVGSYVTWQWTAFVCSVITFIDLLIVINSPESPSWLADQGKYEDCRKVFIWLRGDTENEELEKMIEASKIVRESKADVVISDTFVKNLKAKFAVGFEALRRKEFYKPIFVMVHVYTLGEWAGINILSPYIVEVAEALVDKDKMNVPLLVVTVDAQRIIMNAAAIYFMTKFRRRVILISTTMLCVAVLLLISAYSYAKTSNLLPFDHPCIGAILLHVHMFTIATGSVPLPMTISGEIFPLQFRSVSGALSAVFFSFHLFITVKTYRYLRNSLGLHGTYLIYAAIVTYCLVVSWIFLPETKDRTLQEIEDEFRGGPPTRDRDEKTAEILMETK